MKADSFSLENAVREPNLITPSFTHKVSGGLITFTGAKQSYSFDLRDEAMGDHLFALPAGEYLLEMSSRPASLYGQARGSFIADPLVVNLDEIIDTLAVTVTANCALFLVEDEKNQLDQGIHMIRRRFYYEEYFASFPLAVDTATGLYFTYFTPDTDTSDLSAYLWFYGERPGGEEGGLSTLGFEIGYQYYIKVLE